MRVAKGLIVLSIALGLLAATSGRSKDAVLGPDAAGQTSDQGSLGAPSTPPVPREGGGAGAPPRFQGTITPISAAMRARMTSWRPGCPVPIEDLRLLTVDHWGFDDAVHRGRLVVHEEQAAPLLRVMRALFKARFAIQRMKPVEAYGSDDDRSMAANNTSAFNCRGIPGSGAWSEHAYGRAIDINPIQNPEIRGGVISPAAGAKYADRKRASRGMIRTGDAVVTAFAAIGWSWGGNWRSLKDYQHFSATGQ